MSNNLNLALRLSYDGKAVTTGARQNVNELNRIPQAVQRQVAANQQLGASQARIMQQQGAMTRQLGLMNSAYTQVGATLTALVGIGTATMFVRDTGAAQLLDTRLKGLTGSAENYAKVQEYLFATSDRLNTGYTTLADSYSRVLTLQESGLVTNAQGKAILEGFANVAAKTGASNVQLGQSLFGMTQGMTAGVLRAEELNQVTEPLPGLMQKLDKASGGVAGSFRKMVNAGQVTSAMFKTTLIAALGDYAGAAEATEGTINASFAEMGNEYQRLIRKYEQPVNFAVTSVVDSITDTMAYLRENEGVVNSLMVTTGALATVLTGHLASALAASGKGFIVNIAAKNKAIIADAALAKQAHITAIAENKRALQDIERAKRNVILAQTSQQRAAAQTAVNVAEQRGVITGTALIATTKAYTVAAGSATIASRGLATVMGLLGGPVGLIVTAGIALAYFLRESEKVEKQAPKLKAKLYEIGEAFDSIGNKKAITQLQTTRVEIQKTTEAIAAQYQKLESLKKRQKGAEGTQFHSLFQGQIDKTKDEIAKLTAERAGLMSTTAEIANLQKNLDGLKWTNPDAGIPDHIIKLQESLKSDEEKLKAHYEKRKQIVIAARKDEQNPKNIIIYNGMLKTLQTQYYDDVNTIAARKQAEKNRIENEAEEKRKNDLQNQLDDRLAQIKGLAGREALEVYNQHLAIHQAKEKARVDAARRATKGYTAKDEIGELKYDTDNKVLQIEREKELLIARGFQTQKEADEQAHQDRLREIKLRNNREWADENIAQIQGFNSLAEQEDTAHSQRLMGAFADQYAPAMKSQLVALASFEAQTNAEKANTVVGIGAAMFKSLGKQSKTAFKAHKALAIAQAMINTYQGATAAFKSAAEIPAIGHIIAPIAAAAAVMSGLQQVRQIKAQQPAGIAHGGLDYVPNESTYVLQRGERVLSPKQNTEISQMARRYNAGGAANDGGGSGGVTLNITNQITVQGGANEQTSQAVGQDIARQVVGVVVANIQSNGAIIKAVRGAA